MQRDINYADKSKGKVLSCCSNCGGDIIINTLDILTFRSHYRYVKDAGINQEEVRANFEALPHDGKEIHRISSAECGKCGKMWLYDFDFTLDEQGNFIEFEDSKSNLFRNERK